MMDRLGDDIRGRAGSVKEEIGRMLLQVADACDHQGGNGFKQGGQILRLLGMNNNKNIDFPPRKYKTFRLSY